MQQVTKGWINGFIGMAIFSASLPATRLAVADFDPVFLTAARATIPACIGLVALLCLRQALPKKSDVTSLLITAFGVVLGFPLFTSMALQHITSAHSMIYIGLLPLSTAIFGVLRASERPSPAFWGFSLLGAASVAGFAFFNGEGGALTGDVLMVVAIILCGLGYAEGAKLTRRLGGWQVISWALLISLPVMAPLAIYLAPDNFDAIGPAAWGGFAYVSLFSMFIGFIFWYRGLAIGGIASVGQLQLLQPFLGLMLAAVLIGEHISPGMIGVALLVGLCVAGAKRFSAPSQHMRQVQH